MNSQHVLQMKSKRSFEDSHFPDALVVSASHHSTVSKGTVHCSSAGRLLDWQLDSEIGYGALDNDDADLTSFYSKRQANKPSQHLLGHWQTICTGAKALPMSYSALDAEMTACHCALAALLGLISTAVK